MFSNAHAVLAAGALAIAGCGLTGPAHMDAPPPAVDETVTMGLTSFNPKTIRIRAGQIVQWRNTSLITHTVTADRSLAADPDHVILPQGAEPFHSGDIKAGQVWQRRFPVAGTYRYVCLPHEKKGMIGTIVVEA